MYTKERTTSNGERTPLRARTSIVRHPAPLRRSRATYAPITLNTSSKLSFPLVCFCAPFLTRGTAPATNPFVLTNAAGTQFRRSDDRFKTHSASLTASYRF